MHEFGNWCEYFRITSELRSWIWHSDPADLNVLIRPHPDKIVNRRQSHGKVAVPEADDKYANPLKNE